MSQACSASSRGSPLLGIGLGGLGGGGGLTSTSIAGPGPQPWERRKGFEVDWPVVERPLMA